MVVTAGEIPTCRSPGNYFFQEPLACFDSIRRHDRVIQSLIQIIRR